MKLLGTLSLLTAKLFTLLCFTNMGVIMFDMSVQAAVPCHEEVLNIYSLEDCDTCLVALGAWSENYVEGEHIELVEKAAGVLKGSFGFETVQTNITARLPLVYRPPPQVIFVNAFHFPQKSTVIIV